MNRLLAHGDDLPAFKGAALLEHSRQPRRLDLIDDDDDALRDSDPQDDRQSTMDDVAVVYRRSSIVERRNMFAIRYANKGSRGN